MAGTYSSELRHKPFVFRHWKCGTSFYQLQSRVNMKPGRGKRQRGLKHIHYLKILEKSKE